MTARDLFADLQDPPGGLGIPPSTEAKVPGAVGSMQPQAEARTPFEGKAAAEAPNTQMTCGTCDHRRPSHNGLLSCHVGKVWQAFSEMAPCQQIPMQWKAITKERLAVIADSNTTTTKEHGSATQSVSHNGDGSAETSDTGSVLTASDPRETSQIRDTSMRAIWQLRADGKITERQKELLEFYAERPVGVNFTRQEIARHMTNRHGVKWAINQVCGRVNELIKTGRLRELPGYRKCTVTSESVNSIERGVW
jgi:hypothetical protein